MKEIAIYAALKFAKLRPETVENSYGFLTGNDLPESEKRKLLLPVYDIAGNAAAFLSYVFETFPYPDTDAASRTITRMINRDSYALVRKARKHGVDVEKELELIRRRRRHMLRDRRTDTELIVLDEKDLPAYLSCLFSEPCIVH